MAAAISGAPVKAQLADKLPKRFKELKFGIQWVFSQPLPPLDNPRRVAMAPLVACS